MSDVGNHHHHSSSLLPCHYIMQMLFITSYVISLAGRSHGGGMEGVSLGCSRTESCFMGPLPDTFPEIFFSSTAGPCLKVNTLLVATLLLEYDE